MLYACSFYGNLSAQKKDAVVVKVANLAPEDFLDEFDSNVIVVDLCREGRLDDYICTRILPFLGYLFTGNIDYKFLPQNKISIFLLLQGLWSYFKALPELKMAAHRKASFIDFAEILIDLLEYKSFHALLICNREFIEWLNPISEALPQDYDCIVEIVKRITDVAVLHHTPGYLLLTYLHLYLAHYFSNTMDSPRRAQAAYDAAFQYLAMAKKLVEVSASAIHNAYLGKDLFLGLEKWTGIKFSSFDAIRVYIAKIVADNGYTINEHYEISGTFQAHEIVSSIRQQSIPAFYPKP